jgi:hypothetical protein
MLDAAAHNKAVAGAHRKGFVADGNRELPGHYKHNLIVRVLVASSNPSLLHSMLSQKELLVVRPHAAD